MFPCLIFPKLFFILVISLSFLQRNWGMFDYWMCSCHFSNKHQQREHISLFYTPLNSYFWKKPVKTAYKDIKERKKSKLNMWTHRKIGMQVKYEYYKLQMSMHIQRFSFNNFATVIFTNLVKQVYLVMWQVLCTQVFLPHLLLLLQPQLRSYHARKFVVPGNMSLKLQYKYICL